MKILIVLLTLTLSNFVYATELLQSYDCKNSNDAMQCNSSCLKADQKLELTKGLTKLFGIHMLTINLSKLFHLKTAPL